MALEIQEIHDRGEFERLEAEWDGLLERSAFDAPMLRHAWLRTWHRHFGEDRRLAIILARDGGRLVFAVPLMEVRSRLPDWPAVTLRSFTNMHSFRCEFLLEKGREEAFESFLDYLLRRPRPWHALQVQGVPADSPHLPALLSRAGKRGMRVGSWLEIHSPYMTLKGGWDACLKGLKPKFRSNLRNRARRLAQVGEVRHRVVTGGVELAQEVARCFEIEKLAWKGAAGSAIAISPVLAGFYQEVAAMAAARGWLVLSFLEVGGKAVATDFSLVYGGKYWCMKIGYDPEFRAYSVGQLLNSELVQGCCEGRWGPVSEFDFLGGTTMQKRDWTSEARDVLWITIYRPGIAGALHHGWKHRLKPILKRWAEARRKPPDPAPAEE